MAYSTGTSNNIIVGAAALFTYEAGELTDADLPAYEDSPAKSYKETLSTAPNTTLFRNVGYTMNGLEIVFQPDFGEVQVDQVLDAAKLYKQGMTVNLNTAFAEATLENLLIAIAGNSNDYDDSDSDEKILSLKAGTLGECPVERGIVAVGPGTGECEPVEQIERVYVAYRALSIENVTVAARRDEPTMFEVSFRLLPNSDASYGKIVDRTIPAAS